MPKLPIVLFAAAAAPPLAACIHDAGVECAPREREDGENGPTISRSRPDVAGARELDQEGVRSFREGRYADAARYFRTAFQLGGPSSELWNLARAREKLDDPEGAMQAIQQYLARRDLSAQDRAEAEREARALGTRPSPLTVTTSPAGALVWMDGKPSAGATPLSLELAPGSHTLRVRHPGFVTETRTLEARFGRAVIVSLDLTPASK